MLKVKSKYDSEIGTYKLFDYVPHDCAPKTHDRNIAFFSLYLDMLLCTCILYNAQYSWFGTRKN